MLSALRIAMRAETLYVGAVASATVASLSTLAAQEAPERRPVPLGGRSRVPLQFGVADRGWFRGCVYSARHHFVGCTVSVPRIETRTDETERLAFGLC